MPPALSDLAAGAASIDLSRLPAPDVVAPLDYEAIRSQLIADFRARWPGFDALVESDPAIKLLEVAAYRELLLRAAINDTARGLLVAFAGGADLEQLAAFHGVTRFLISEATDTEPALYESDEALRRRVLLAPEAHAGAGPIGAWLFHTLSADPRVLNADIWSPEPGQVIVAVQTREGDGEASAELLDAVRAHLAQPHIKPLTDILTVRSVVNVPYGIAVEGFVLPGPAPAPVREAMIASLTRMAAARRTPSRDVPRSAVIAAASVDPIDKVIVTAPAADVARARGEVAICTGITVEVTAHAG